MKNKVTLGVAAIFALAFIPIWYAQEAGEDEGAIRLNVQDVTIDENVNILAAVESIVEQVEMALSYRDLLSDEEVELMRTTRTPFYTQRPMEWQRALREVLEPAGMDYLEDDGIILIGPVDQIEMRFRAYEQDRLRRNRTLITVDFSGGMPLYYALLTIQNLAGLNMNYDFMEPADRIVEEQTSLDADAAAQRPAGKQTTYRTPEGIPIEWRTVLKQVLSPWGYDFLEEDGVVLPMLASKRQARIQQQVDALPLATRFIRVYHNDPTVIAARINAMAGLLRHGQASVTVAQGWDNNSLRYTGSSAGVPTTGEGTQLGGDVEGISSFGSLRRLTVPPALLVRDVEDNLAVIEEKIRMLDRRERQILIEARIFDLGKNSSRDLGVLIEQFGGSVNLDTSYNYDLNRNRANRRNIEEVSRFERDRERSIDAIDAFNNTAESVDTYTQSRIDERIYESARDSLWGMAQQVVLNPLQLSAAWQAIEEAGDGKVVSQPVIVVGDHNEAVIKVSTLEPVLQLRTEFLPESNNTIQSYEWQVLNIGLTLWVVPEINVDGSHVRLSIHPSVTERIGDSVTAPDGSRYPVLASRELDTRVSVPDQHTLLLGGLIRSSGSVTERKVPLLGDIPILGNLFRYRSNNKDQQNLVILITPTILDDEEPVSGYEAPTLGVTNPMLEELGKRLPYDPDAVEGPMAKHASQPFEKGVEDSDSSTAEKKTASRFGWLRFWR